MKYKVIIGNQKYKVWDLGHKYDFGENILEEDTLNLNFDETRQLFEVKILNPSEHTKYLSSQGRLGIVLRKNLSNKPISAMLRTYYHNRSRGKHLYWVMCSTKNNDGTCYACRINNKEELNDTFYLDPSDYDLASYGLPYGANKDHGHSYIGAMLCTMGSSSEYCLRPYKSRSNILHIHYSNTSDVSTGNVQQIEWTVSSITETRYRIQIRHISERWKKAFDQGHLKLNFVIYSKERPQRKHGKRLNVCNHRFFDKRRHHLLPGGHDIKYPFPGSLNEYGDFGDILDFEVSLTDAADNPSLRCRLKRLAEKHGNDIQILATCALSITTLSGATLISCPISYTYYY